MESRIATSDNHPIIVNKINGFNMGITICPGKNAPKSLGYRWWARDISKDAFRIKSKYKATCVLNLLSTYSAISKTMVSIDNFSSVQHSELLNLGVSPQEYEKAFYLTDILSFSMEDNKVPKNSFEHNFKKLRIMLYKHLAEGEFTVIHCNGGLGRSAIMAARIMIDFEITPAEAIKTIEKCRPGAFHIQEQRDFILEY